MMASAAAIRPLRTEDGAAVVRLVAALSAHEGKAPPNFTLAHFRRDIMGPSAFVRGFIAHQGGEAVGYLLYHLAYDSESGERGAYMCDLFVEEKARRQGIARALMQAAARAVRDGGGRFLWWSAKSYNVSAISFYRTVGEEERNMTTWASFNAAFQALLDETSRR